MCGRSTAVLFAAITLFAAGLAAQTSNPSFERLLEQHRAQPGDWKLCNQIAIHYTQVQEFERAAEFFRKVLKLNPQFIPARKNLAVVLWFGGKKIEAETQFRNLLDVLPADPVPYLYLGLACHDRGRHSEARQHFAKAGDLAMRNPEVLPAVLNSYLAAGDPSIITPVVQFLSESRDPQLAARVAAVLNGNSKHESTIAALEKLDNLDAEGQLLLAEAYDSRNMPERAYASYAKALAASPDDEKVYTALAAFASAHGNNRFGLEMLEKGLTRQPRSAQLLLHKGLLTAMEGDREAAAKSLKLAAAADPKWSVPVFAFGVLQLEAGRVDDAVGTFRQAIRDFPQEHRAYYFCALALSRTAGTGGSEQIQLLEKAVELQPKDGKARTLLGQTYIGAGQLTKGIAELERVTRDDPKNATALYQLALAYRKAGNAGLAQQRMAAFRELKAAAQEKQTELVQFLKVIK
jgi:Flp pilus assembly protein TadD